MKKRSSLIGLLSWALLAAACGGGDDVEGDPGGTMSKADARSLAKADWGSDLCELFGWYDDGVCDDFCPLPDPDCRPVDRPEKLWGVDANYLGFFESEGYRWQDGGQDLDPIAFLADRGARTFRMRIWIEAPEQWEPGTLQDSLPVAVRAQDAGMYVIPTLFMSKGWGADNSQYPPQRWMALPVAKRAVLARRWAAKTVGELVKAGIATHTYAIGNETDYGFCGEFQYGADLTTLRNKVWPAAAKIFLAVQEGVKRATGRNDLEFILHISRGYDRELAAAFFGFMRSHGVQVDLAGLSFYPSAGAWGQQGYDAFFDTVDLLYESYGLQTFIAEYAYPARPLSGWSQLIHGTNGNVYTIDEAGQALFVHDVRELVTNDFRFAGAAYWSPEEAAPGSAWSAMSLFQTGTAYPPISPAPRQAAYQMGAP